MNAPHNIHHIRRDRADPLGADRLGEILRRHDWVSDEHLEAAYPLMALRGRTLGDTLVAEGWASPEAVAHATAEQWRLGYADLDRDPPTAGLANPGDLDLYLQHRILPWRHLRGMTVYVVEDPEQGRAALSSLTGSSPFAFFAVTTRGKMDRALRRVFQRDLVQRAIERVPEHDSVRSMGWARIVTGGALVALILSFVLFGAQAMVGPLVVLFLLNASTAAIRFGALIAGRREWRPPELPPETVRLSEKRPLPRISVLVPLYREAEMVEKIGEALSAIDYPRALLDAKILMEQTDVGTLEAVTSADLPHWIQPLVVPAGKPRTKPRALNYALDFCTGDIIGILDAEDNPDPQQLRRVAEHFANATPETACVQCQLSYFNAQDNWITRCFQLEYSIWFDVLLRGFERLGLPIPLGGTSVYFRRAPLAEIGAWDAHNVTEDADLGMRLVRRGYRTAMVDSVTLEEANCRALPWVRQRSRWLKGYLMTWLCHMRQPVRLWQDMGPRGFFGFNVLFLGGAATYLAMPLFWLSVFAWITTGDGLWGHTMPAWMLYPLYVSLGAGQLIMIGTAYLAMWRRRSLDLLLWVPILPFYWTLGSAAAWKAVLELIVAPYYWDKTRHGISRTQLVRKG